jgi:hypothetical protein
MSGKNDPISTSANRDRHSRKSWIGRLLADVVYVARRDKKWWLLPLIVVVLVLAALSLLAASAGPLSPFIYPFL